MRIRRKRFTFFSFIGYIFLSIFLVILLSFLGIFFFLFKDYSNWQKIFETERLTTDYVYSNDAVLKKSTDEKILTFSKSVEKTDTIQLIDKEVLYLISNSLNSSLPTNFSYKRGYVQSQDGYWNVYIQLTVKEKYQLPWMLFVITKDDMETPEIYVKTISIGNYDLKDWYMEGTIIKINKGIRDGIQLVNTSDFSGRIFRNIELEKGIMTIKGAK
ncbi:hypothetical protein M0R04_02350 [Candidatus Dojkabacteria bacterium]|jgi:hypothetical protein|nr:hypothetical protein [Candidatus Dojkabacteria bacterium]